MGFLPKWLLDIRALLGSSANGKVLGRSADAWEFVDAGGDSEPPLGNPSTNGQVLSSTTDGTRSWVDQSGGAGVSLNVGLLPGSFNLIGASAEPAFTTMDGTNLDMNVLDYADGATELNAFFCLPSKFTSQYSGSADIKIDVDFYLTGTLTEGHTVIFGVGLIEMNTGATVNLAPPTTSTGYSSATHTIGASESASYRRTVTITITADASISAGQLWVGRLIRKTGTDTSVASAKVMGITVYE